MLAPLDLGKVTIPVFYNLLKLLVELNDECKFRQSQWSQGLDFVKSSKMLNALSFWVRFQN